MRGNGRPRPPSGRRQDARSYAVYDQLDRSAHGQAATSRALARLTERGWLHLDDLHWPGRARAVIDHVAIGPGGICVVTTVHWLGPVEVRRGRVHHRGRPQAVQDTAASAAAAVRTSLPLEDLRRHVVPVLSVVNNEPLDAVANGVVVSSAETLDAVLARRPAVLNTAEVARTGAFVWGTLGVGQRESCWWHGVRQHLRFDR